MKKMVLVFLISALGIQAYSQSYKLSELNNGKRHRGFYLSWAGGVYQSSVEMEDNSGYTKVKGIGGVMDFKIGVTLVENLILHATWLSHGIYEPKVYDKNNRLAGAEANNIELSEVMFGGGITYYTPLNFLLSSSIGYGGFTLSDETNNDGSSSEGGFCLQIKAGKEWWISRKLALGLAAY